MEKGYNVTITFESFHTEREFDVLEVFDGKAEITPKSTVTNILVCTLYSHTSNPPEDMMFCFVLVLALFLLFLSLCLSLSQVLQRTVPLWQL